jgi:long-chain acyl-CoA synthetase
MGMPPTTICELYHQRVEKDGDRVATYHKDPTSGRWVASTWAQGAREVNAIANGLLACGVAPGDRVGIISETRREWALCDLAIVNVGAITVGIYPTSTVEQIAHILKDAGVRIIFVEDLSQLHRVTEAFGDTGGMEAFIVFEQAGLAQRQDTRGISEIMSMGREHANSHPGAYTERWQATKPDDLAMLVYTSGTTGPPKGVMLTHYNICTTVHSISTVLPNRPDDLGVVFLPLAHSLQRVVGYAGIATGARSVFAERLDKIVDHMKEFHPTVQAAVPRIFEKIHARIMRGVEEAPPPKKVLFRWAVHIGSEVARLNRQDRPVPLPLKAQHKLAEKLVLSKIRDVFGGSIRYMVSGAAPISSDLLEFFHACGILILEGYGLTETTAPATVNRVNSFRFGTVGLDLPICETRIADDGEILIKGDNVFVGYWQDEEATTEAFTDDGWFKTGDIGTKDTDGYLKITDRKKEIIITAAGKNVSPANIEKKLRGDPLISQCVVHGDQRRYLTALITLDADEIGNVAQRLNLTETSYEALCRHPRMLSEVQIICDRVNRHLARYETIKYFKVLDKDLSVEDGYLTPTLKLKRRNIKAAYADLIDSLYVRRPRKRE